MTTATGAPPAATSRHRRAERLGWGAVAVLTLLVLLSWSPSLTAGLGDNHEGRILGRHALHVTNAQQDGLAGSGWLSDWQPYAGGPEQQQQSYAHHPPLMNLGYYASAQLLPVRLDVALRLFAYLTGVALLPLGAAVLRRLGFAWAPVLVATTAIAITPLFWVYGRLNGSVSLLAAMMLLVVRLRERRPIGTRELVLGAVVSLLAVLAGYLGLATAALLGLWLLAHRGLDRVTIAIGAAMAAGAAITFGYVLAGSGAGELTDQVRSRTRGGDFTVARFVERIGRWLRELLPGWWRWALAPAALIAGLLDRRSRALTALLGVVAVAYVVGLPNGSFIHDYWIYPVLLPVWLGVAALGQAVIERSPRWRTPVVLGGGALIIVLGVAGLVRADVYVEYLGRPQAAGTLVREVAPPPSQQVAWRTDGIATPRWLSHYWDLPPGEVTDERVDEVADDALVLVKLSRAPDWLGTAPDIAAAAAHVHDGYALVTGAQLRELAAAASGATSS